LLCCCRTLTLLPSRGNIVSVVNLAMLMANSNCPEGVASECVHRAKSPFVPVLERSRLAISRLLPHDTSRTTCPPGPVRAGAGPLVLVPSLMRSGTHLLLDSLFNNFSLMQRRPLFLDFDAYERAGLNAGVLESVGGLTIKTHYPEVDLAVEYSRVLKQLASKAVIITPVRPHDEIQRSMAKWGLQVSLAELEQIQARFDLFWGEFDPIKIDFRSLLDDEAMSGWLVQVGRRLATAPRYAGRVLMPAKSRLGVYCDKMLTRLLGSVAPRINTTIGYRLGVR
jgi:hypothetical protein